MNSDANLPQKPRLALSGCTWPSCPSAKQAFTTFRARIEWCRHHGNLVHHHAQDYAKDRKPAIWHQCCLAIITAWYITRLCSAVRHTLCKYFNRTFYSYGVAGFTSTTLRGAWRRKGKLCRTSVMVAVLHLGPLCCSFVSFSSTGLKELGAMSKL